jgi:hypothetical protein
MELGIGARVNHPKFGEGVVYGMDLSSLKIFFKTFGEKEIDKNYENLEIISEGAEVKDHLTLEDVEIVLTQVLQRYADFTMPVPLGDRWRGGMMILQPGGKDLASKEIPVETFFHKIVMIRDRIRVMEQQINSSNLSDEEKVNLQQYITRIYGSLTTFNILFKNKEDYFVGESKRKD